MNQAVFTLISDTQKSISLLETAMLTLPEEKRSWGPGDAARSAFSKIKK